MNEIKKAFEKERNEYIDERSLINQIGREHIEELKGLMKELINDGIVSRDEKQGMAIFHLERKGIEVLWGEFDLQEGIKEVLGIFHEKSDENGFFQFPKDLIYKYASFLTYLNREEILTKINQYLDYKNTFFSIKEDGLKLISKN